MRRKVFDAFLIGAMMMTLEAPRLAEAMESSSRVSFGIDEESLASNEPSQEVSPWIVPRIRVADFFSDIIIADTHENIWELASRGRGAFVEWSRVRKNLRSVSYLKSINAPLQFILKHERPLVINDETRVFFKTFSDKEFSQYKNKKMGLVYLFYRNLLEKKPKKAYSKPLVITLVADLSHAHSLNNTASSVISLSSSHSLIPLSSTPSPEIETCPPSATQLNLRIAIEKRFQEAIALLAFDRDEMAIESKLRFATEMKHRDAPYLLGLFYYSDKRWRKAITFLKLAIERRPHPDASYYMGKAFEKIAQSEEARAAYETYAYRSDDRRIQLALCRLFTKSEFGHLSNNFFTQFPRLQDYSEFQHFRARWSWGKQNHELAVFIWRKMAERSTFNDERSQLLLASIGIENDLYVEALEWINHARTEYHSSEALHLAGVLYERKGELNTAISYFKRAADENFIPAQEAFIRLQRSLGRNDLVPEYEIQLKTAQKKQEQDARMRIIRDGFRSIP